MEQLRQKISDLSPEQRAQLEKRLLQRRRKTAGSNTIPRRDTQTPCPTSFAQQRLWFMDQFLRGSAAYNMSRAYRLQGSLNIPALEHSLNEIIRRQESLRTTFTLQDGEPVQIIHPAGKTRLAITDLSDLAPDTRETEIQQLLQQETQTGFDLELGPLLRIRLLQLDDKTHVLSMMLHHIISDGWSQSVLFLELTALYNATIQGLPSPLPELPTQYADFSIWQKSPEQERELEKQLEYWKKQLTNPTSLELPTDRPRQAVQTFNGAIEGFVIPATQTGKLKALSQQAGGTLFMILLAAVHILLQRYSGTNDIVTGSPIAGRNRTELEGLIGFFINTLVMRSDLSDNPIFLELFSRVRETALGAYSHQSLPFERLVETLLPDRDLSKNPFFQVMFALQNAPSADLQLEGLTSTSEKTLLESAKFDLTIELIERQDELHGRINYNTDLFDKTTIVRMAGHFQTLLENITTNPECAISELSLLTASERRQLLAEWNDTATKYPDGVCAYTLFEAHAEQSPDAVAVISGDTRLRYDELNVRANQLAHHLISRGIGPKTLVGICLDRSPELPVAILGVQKAGAAYVPLDPSYPEARLAYMLDDAGAPLLLTRASLLSGLPDFSGELLCMDNAGEQLDHQSTANPEPAATTDNLAYIIYTSGSTGEPKGVEVTHAGLTNLVCWHIRAYQLDTADRITHLSGLGFDASVWDLWPCLAAGAGLYLIPEELRRSPPRLWSWIAAQGITLSFMPTPLAEAALQEALPDGLALRVLLTGGDRLHGGLTDKALPFRVVNHYGPTENTVVATCADVDLLTDGEPHIGKPIDNVHTYILDKQQQPVPVGIAGELYIGGNSLARGYHNQPALTAEKFIASPFSSDPAERLYRSGDRVRYLADGNIDFLGRVDEQIKLRGFRVVPGEIEAALCDLPNIEQAIVLLHDDIPGREQLIAYVTGGPVDSASIRTALKTRLPEFMVPTTIVPLDELPLTANGKIDRAALPAPDGSETTSREKVMPRNKLELHLVKLWENLLGTEPVGVTDDFFALGGHSLLAARMFDEIKTLFGKELPLDTLWFGGATIEHLAQVISADESTVSWPTLIRIKSGGERPPLFCIHTQGGNLFHYDDLAGALAKDQPVYGLQACGVYGREAFHDSVEDIAAHCIEKMTERSPDGPHQIIGFSSGGIVAYEMAQQLLQAGRPPALVALVDTYPPHVRRHGHYLRRMKELLSRENLRYFQERAYHAVMQPLKLGRYRQLSSIGEAHRWAHWSYRPRPYPGDVALFLAEDSLNKTSNPTLGWDKLIEKLHVHKLPGSHAMMVKPPHVSKMTAVLESLFKAADSRDDFTATPAEKTKTGT
jgi:amino acid adenylation domain-containing protein